MGNSWEMKKYENLLALVLILISPVLIMATVFLILSLTPILIIGVMIMALTAGIKRFFLKKKKEEKKRKLKDYLDKEDVPINECNLYEISKND